MEKIVLSAKTRTGKPGQVRKAGFIPAVLNKPDTTSYPVQFEAIPLNRAIAHHGSNARLWVDFDGSNQFGYVKELQKDPVEGKIIHVSIQLVSQKQEVKMQVPIAYHGLEALENRFLQLNIIRSEIALLGQAVQLPEVLSVDVSEMDADESIVSANFKIGKNIQILDPEDEVYAIVKPHKGRQLAEEEGKAEPEPAGEPIV